MKAVRYAAWILAGLLLLVHALVAATHTFLVMMADMRALSPFSVAGAYWALILMGAAVFIAGFYNVRSPGSSAYMRIIAVMIVLMASGLAWLATDAPPVTNDYSEQDIACSGNGSFEYLSILNSKESFLPDKPCKDKPRDVTADWAAILEQQRAIAALDRLDRVCSLPEFATFTEETRALRYMPFKETARIYNRYFLAQVSDGQPNEATEALCQLHRVTRKGMHSASMVINKMIFCGMIQENIEASWLALQDENIDLQTLVTLQKNFTPLEIEELSQIQVLIGEYLFVKNFYSNVEPGGLLGSLQQKPEQTQLLKSLLSSMVYFLGFNPNRSVADQKIYYDLLINAYRNHPVDLTQAEAYKKAYIKNPPIRNMVGWILNSVSFVDFSRYFDRLIRLKIKSDLLALSLNQKLGQPVSLTDFYTGQKLRYRSEGALLRHPGRDGAFDTPDDIVLGKKPEAP